MVLSLVLVSRCAWLLAASAALPLACGEASEEKRPPPGAGRAQPLSGLYEVSGTTVDKVTGAERKVAGTLIVDVEGEAYTTTFDLATNIFIQGDSRRAELIGRGEDASKTARSMAPRRRS